jgi:hypothetical protein
MKLYENIASPRKPNPRDIPTICITIIVRPHDEWAAWRGTYGTDFDERPGVYLPPELLAKYKAQRRRDGA